MRALARLRAVLAAEEGIAVGAALGVLLVVSILVGAAVTRAVGLNSTSDDDRDSKRALAAAEAGLQAAAFRINRLAPTNGLCITDVVVEALPELGCPEYEEDLGNGARYTYKVTPVLNLTDTCAGLPIQTTNGTLTVIQRCITSVGEVRDVRRRVQMRVAAFQGNPIFPAPGIIGLEGVTLNNASTVDGWVASNGLIDIKNSSTISGLELGPAAPDPALGGSSIGQIVRRTNAEGPIVLAPVEIGDSATVNDNARISNGLANPKIAPYDASSGVSYDAGTRTLTMGSNSSLTLGGGTYNFCRLSMGNNALVTIAPRPAGQPQGVRIFIDSPYRQGSGCSGAGAGTFTMGQKASFGSPPDGDVRNLQLYVYGWSPAESPTPSEVEFNNSAFAGVIYAPQSRLIFKNNSNITGAVAGQYVEFKNDLTFGWEESAGEIRARALQLFYRTAWKECPKDPTDPANLGSGC
jgi:hypothetical protein